jgi:hypothetical protein
MYCPSTPTFSNQMGYDSESPIDPSKMNCKGIPFVQILFPLKFLLCLSDSHSFYFLQALQGLIPKGSAERIHPLLIRKKKKRAAVPLDEVNHYVKIKLNNELNFRIAKIFTKH